MTTLRVWKRRVIFNPKKSKSGAINGWSIQAILWDPFGRVPTELRSQDWDPTFFVASRGALRNHSPSAPTSPSSGKPLPFFDLGGVLGWIWAPNWPKVGGAVPGFEPRTSCMRVRSASYYATGAAPWDPTYFKSFFTNFLEHSKCCKCGGYSGPHLLGNYRRGKKICFWQFLIKVLVTGWPNFT